MKKKLRQKYETKKHLKVPCDCGHKSAGIPEEAFDERQVHIGAAVEFEHTCSREKAERIAMDHLREFPIGYYKELAKMENKLEKINSKKQPHVKLPEPKRKKCKPKKK